MTDEKVSTASTSTDSHKRTWARQLEGTSFLTFEHASYFALVVLVPIALLLAADTALKLWQGNYAAFGTEMFSYGAGTLSRSANIAIAPMLIAALIVLAPLLYIIRRRTSAEYAKRPGYERRVGYKLPIYVALGVLTALSVGAFVNMLGIFLNSLVNIGVKGADIGGMYTHGFLPALLAFLVFASAGWYVCWFAKGRDSSRTFVGSSLVLAAVLAIALFVTVMTINHDSTPAPDRQIQPYSTDDSFLRY